MRRGSMRGGMLRVRTVGRAGQAGSLITGLPQCIMLERL